MFAFNVNVASEIFSMALIVSYPAHLMSGNRLRGFGCQTFKKPQNPSRMLIALLSRLRAGEKHHLAASRAAAADEETGLRIDGFLHESRGQMDRLSGLSGSRMAHEVDPDGKRGAGRTSTQRLW